MKGKEFTIKRLIVLCLALLITGTIALAQQSAEWRPNISEDNKAASLKDTTEFLKQVLAARSRIQSQPDNPNKFIEKMVLRAAASESCTLSYVEREIDTTNSNARASFPVHEYTLQLGKIDPLSVIVKGLDATEARFVSSGFNVELSGHNEDPIGTVIGAIYSPQYVDKGSWFKEIDQADFPCTQGAKPSRSYRSCSNQPASDVTSVKLSFTDQEYAHRFARALMHAALLCGGTKSVSPF